MTNYDQLPALAGVYLEDGYVLAIDETRQQLSFSLLAVLTPHHPAYRGPLPGEPYCYAYGVLTFANASRIEWERRSGNHYVDADGAQGPRKHRRACSD